MARKKKKEKEELTEEVVYSHSPEKTWSWKPEEPVTSEPPKKLYTIQLKFGLERWQDATATVELLGDKIVKIGGRIASPTATVRGGWRFFEGDGVVLKLREDDWQRLLA